MNKPRRVRLFISSTFRDMQLEREELVKRVFPELRRLCESRGAAWTAIDLRWGVTEDQATRGEVVPVCLGEVDRCNFFLALIGERYGWVPGEVPPAMAERYPALAEGRSRSLTELEILHAVLNHPPRADHAYFYFRDPLYLDRLPPGARREDYESEGTESVARLQELKERIRRHGAPLRDNYRDPQELGRLVLRDLSDQIERLFPPGSPSDAEAAAHEAYAAGHVGVYVGRPAYFERLDQHAAGRKPPLVVLAEPGTGKSALLANWCLHFRAAAEAGGDAPPLVTHFVGATPASTDCPAMLRRLMGELKRRLGLPRRVPDNLDAAREEFGDWLHAAGERGPVVLLIDGLNRLVERDGALEMAWLPERIPVNVRLILSTPAGRPWEALKPRGWPALRIDPLDPDERRSLIRDYLALHGKALSHARAERIAAAATAAHPLYLRTLLEELCLFGVHERLDERIGHYLEAPTADRLYEKVLQRWEQDYERDRPGLVHDAAALLWAARDGLAEHELLELLGAPGAPLPQAHWSPLALAAGGAFADRGGLLGFDNAFLREAVRRRHLHEESLQRAAHRKIADYFRPLPNSLRRLAELPWQLTAASDWPALREVLADLRFVAALNEEQLAEFTHYWEQLRRHSESGPLDAYSGVIADPQAHADVLPRVADLLSIQGHFAEELSLREAQVALARERADPHAIAEGLCRLSALLWLRSEYERLPPLIDETERIYTQLGDDAGLARCLNQRAQLVRATRRDWAEALRLHREEEKLLRRAGDRRSLPNCINNQAVQLKRLGDAEAALDLYSRAERLCREMGNVDGLAATLANRATAVDDYDEGLRLLGEAELIYRGLGKVLSLANVLRLQVEAVFLDRQAADTPFDTERTRRLKDVAVPKAREAAELFTRMGAAAEAEAMRRRAGALAELAASDLSMQEMEIPYELRRHFARAPGAPRRETPPEPDGSREFSPRSRADADGTAAPPPDKRRQVFELLRRARALLTRGDQAGAIGLLREQERLCRELGDAKLLGACLTEQAGILLARNHLHAAHDLQVEIEQLYRESGDMHGLQTALGNRAVILEAGGRFEQAFVLLRDQERICRETNNRTGLTFALANLSAILHRRGSLDEALALLEEETQICEENGDHRGTASSLGRRASLLHDMGRLEHALDLFERGEFLSREIGDVESLAITLGNHAWVLYDAMKKPAEALPLIEEAYELARTRGLVRLEQHLQLNLAAIRDALS